MYKHDRNSGKSFRGKSREKNTPETKAVNRAPVNSGTPTPPSSTRSQTSETFVKRSFSDLSFYKSIQVKADPNTEISETADPYAVLNYTNVVIDANYAGKPNAAGNIVLQLARGSNSTFQDISDYIRLKIKLNYNYQKLTATSKAPQAINDQTNNIWLDVQSKLQAEAFYNIPFFSWEVTGTTFYSDTLLDIVNYYQVFLQTAIMIPLTYRKVLSMEKHLKDMTFYKGSAIVERFYGMIKKSSFKALVDTISKGVSSNFIDTKWFEEVSLFVTTPSRKSNSMNEALMDIWATYEHNDDLTVSINTGSSSTELFNTGSLASFFTNAEYVFDNLSLETILSKSRLATSSTNPNDWFNPIVTALTVMSGFVNEFNTKFNDMNVAFKSMVRLDLTEWKPGQYVETSNIDNTYAPKYNVMIEDIYRSIFSGSASISYNNTINKWIIYDLWDEFTGIPRYTKDTGGAFLTFAAKDIDSTGAPANILYPVLFSFNTSKIVTRVGTTIPMTRTLHTFTNSPEISRLIPLGNLDAIVGAFPTIDIGSLASAKSKSWVSNMQLKLMGWYYNTQGSTNFIAALPSRICLVDIEQDDVTNAMIDFIRQTSPFRTIKPTNMVQIGFKRNNTLG